MFIDDLIDNLEKEFLVVKGDFTIITLRWRILPCVHTFSLQFFLSDHLILNDHSYLFLCY